MTEKIGEYTKTYAILKACKLRSYHWCMHANNFFYLSDLMKDFKYRKFNCKKIVMKNHMRFPYLAALDETLVVIKNSNT